MADSFRLVLLGTAFYWTSLRSMVLLSVMLAPKVNPTFIKICISGLVKRLSFS